MHSTAITNFTRYLSANRTDASFPSRVPTTTEPTDVIALSEFTTGPDHLLIVPFGTGNENDTFHLRLIGWRQVFREGTTSLWVPVLLLECTCTLGATVGVSGAAVSNSERFVDTITLATGNANVTVEIVSPGNDLLGHLLVDVKGFSLLEVTFDIGSGTTGMNVLYATL